MEKIITPNQLIINLSGALVLNDKGQMQRVVEHSLMDLATIVSVQRVIIFQYHSDGSFSAQYEWHHDSLPPLKSSLQLLKPDEYRIMGKFKSSQSSFCLSDTNDLPESYPTEAKLFFKSGCRSYCQFAMKAADRLSGFISIFKSSERESCKFPTPDFMDIVAELYRILLEKLNQPLHYGAKTDFSAIPSFSSNLQQNNESFPALEKIFANILFGMAVYDSASGRFIYYNDKCLELLSIPRDKGNFAKDVFKILRNNGYDTGNFFYFDGQLKDKLFVLDYNKKYINGSVSKIKGSTWMVMSLADLSAVAGNEQNEQFFKQQIMHLSEAAIELVSPLTENKDIYRFIGETAFSMLNNAIVMINRYYPKEGYMKTEFVKGFGFQMDIIAKLIGKHPLHKTYPLEVNSEEYNVLLSSRIKALDGGLAQLSLGIIPEPAARKIEKIANISKVYICGLYDGNTLYGNINFLMRPDTIINDSILEAFSRLAGNALHAKSMRSMLRKTSATLADAVHLAKIGYWEYDYNEDNLIVTTNYFTKVKPDIKVVNEEGRILINLEEFIREFTFNDDGIKLREMIEAAREKNINDHFSRELEFRLKLPGEETRHIYTRAIMRKPGRLTGVAQDISKIRRVEQSLRESELKFRSLVEQSHDAIIVVKENGVITEWNPRAEALTGMKAAEVLGRLAWEVESAIIFNPTTKRRFTSLTEEQLKVRFLKFFRSSSSRKPFVSDVKVYKNDGSAVNLSVTSFIFTTNQNNFLCRIAKDVTREKQKQQKEKEREIMQNTARAKELFLENMSHEMRTPLSGILGMTEILQNTPLTSDQLELIDVIKESSDSLLELITGIQELSRLEKEGVIIKQEPFHLRQMMEKTMNIFKAAAAHKNIELVLTDHTPAHITVSGDEFHLRQALGNLIGNAIKFTPAGGRVEAAISSARVNLMELEVLIEIIDNGIGIEENKLPLLFHKFSQVDNSFTREYDGVGIGLSISRELIKLMGGQIGVKSDFGKGSVFWLKVKLMVFNDND